MLFGADGALWKRRLGHGLVKFGPGLKGGSPAASRVFLSKFGENFVRGFSNHLAAANLAKALAQLGLPSRFYFLVSALVERMEQKGLSFQFIFPAFPHTLFIIAQRRKQ